MDYKDPDLFIPPSGMIRSITPDKREEYLALYKALGSFNMHEYDLDICKLYRQMDDLKERYANFGSRPYSEYLNQIKVNLELELKRLKLNADFYLNHFYYVLRPDNPAYLSYMGLFLALCDPYRVVPVLEYHYGLISSDAKYAMSEEVFLGHMEYLTCNFLRTNRFPEDWFAKHEKVMNWIYVKRDTERYRTEMNLKLDLLIESINKINPKNKISNEVVRPKTGKKVHPTSEVSVMDEMVDILIQDLSGYFSNASVEALREILKGKGDPSIKVMFDGQANQLIDVFRIYLLAKFIKSDKRLVAKWICNHFMYMSKKVCGFVHFEIVAVERVIYSKNPVTRENRVPLSNLPKSREEYYILRKKMPSDDYSDI